jgi:YD repeat-containing protein
MPELAHHQSGAIHRHLLSPAETRCAGGKLSMIDPDKNTVTYSYNHMSELFRQTDAKGQIHTLFYDALG